MKFLITKERPKTLFIDHENGKFSAVMLEHPKIRAELQNKTIESYVSNRDLIVKYSLKELKDYFPPINEDEFLTLNELLLLEGI